MLELKKGLVLNFKNGMLLLASIALIGCTNGENKGDKMTNKSMDKGSMNKTMDKGSENKELKKDMMHSKKASINLNAKELSFIGGEEKDLLEGLLSKATYEEAKENMVSPEEKDKLERLERQAVNNYYVLTEASKKVDIKPNEIKKVYEKNKKDLKGKTLEEVTPAIKNLIYEARVKNEVIKMLNKIKKDNKIVEAKEVGTPKQIEEMKKEAADNLSKAVYKEAMTVLVSSDEKIMLEFLKQKEVNDYYVLSIANKKIDVTPTEIKDIYEKNKKDLEGKTLEEVTPKIKDLIYESKLKDQVVAILKDIKTKYNLNQKVEQYMAKIKENKKMADAKAMKKSKDTKDTKDMKTMKKANETKAMKVIKETKDTKKMKKKA